MEILTAADVSFEALHECANDAFSDYVVPAQLTLEQWHGMVTQRGLTPELSLIAVEDGIPLAYWLTGLAPKDRPGTAYAISVGTRPRARRRGLAAQLFAQLHETLKARGFAEMIHEVIVDNVGAVKLYESLGYKSARRVVSYRGDIAKDISAPDGAVVREINMDEAEEIAHAVGGWQPTWQNEFHAMRLTGEACKAFAVDLGGRTSGYGVVVPAYQQLTQIGTVPKARRQGLGSALLAHWRDTLGFETCRILNVPDTDETFAAFAAARGWEYQLAQYEMVLKL